MDESGRMSGSKTEPSVDVAGNVSLSPHLRPRCSRIGQFTALHQLGPNNVAADAKQPRRLHLVAMAEFIGCSRDCGLNLRVKVGTAIFKERQQCVTQRFVGPCRTAGCDSKPECRKP